MTPQTTLDAVRELSERAMLRPAPLRLPLTRREQQRPGPQRAIIAFEELHPARIGGTSGRASGQRSRKPRAQHASEPAGKKDFMQRAADKIEAKILRLPFATPAED